MNSLTGEAGHLTAGSPAADILFSNAIGHAKEGALDETAGQSDAAGARYSESLLLLESLMRDAVEKGDAGTVGKVKSYRDMVLERLKALSQ